MATKWIANVNEHYTAEAIEYAGYFSVNILKDNEEEHSIDVAIYTLRDASTWIRRYLKIKGARIKWEKVDA